MSDPWKEKREIGNATLYLGDALELRERIPKDAAIIADPPYGIAHVKGAGGHGKHSRRNIAPIHGDDAPFDPAPWLAFPSVILWGADHYAERLPHGRWLAWDKLDGMEAWDSFSDVEFAWHSKRGAARLFRLLWKGIASVKAGEEATRDHPTQKPIALMKWCLEQAGMPETVADPYMGSGTTGVACMQAGRRFVGVEIDPAYFEIASSRIENAQRQQRMFP